MDRFFRVGILPTFTQKRVTNYNHVSYAFLFFFMRNVLFPKETCCLELFRTFNQEFALELPGQNLWRHLLFQTLFREDGREGW